jgi:hypothetical protein
MRTAHPADRLAAVSRTFGPAAARQKLRLLDEIARTKRSSYRQIILLRDILYFLRAYPDNARVLDAVRSRIAALKDVVDRETGGDPQHPRFLNSGLPGTCNTETYSYAVLQRLVRLFPGRLDLDWEEITYEPTFVDALNLAVLPGESRGLEDEYLGLRDWLQRCKTEEGQTDLETVLQLFEGSRLNPRERAHAFEACEYPMVYHLGDPGSSRCEAGLELDQIFFQRKSLAPERFRLGPKIVQPLEDYWTLDESAGRRMTDMSLAALCSRNLEIHPLMYANPADVTVVECGRGLRIILAGVLPEFRAVVETDLFFLILKNGVPVAYGPASIFLGCCEMGINLFPEFRGGEIRYIYSQFMRALYHLADVRYFFLTSYGMGDGNPEALKSGAFWFYRKLGFRAANPDVESLARQEERKIRRRRGYRSPMPILRELALTDAYFDLSGGACKPICFEDLGHAVSRYVTVRFGGSRERAQRHGVRSLIQLLEIDDFSSWTKPENTALRRLAPVLVQVPGLSAWPAVEKRSLVASIRAKGGRSEFEYIRLLRGVPRLGEALHTLASRTRDQ